MWCTWHGVPSLLVEFFSDEQLSVDADGASIEVSVDGCSCSLSREQARQLQEAIGDAMTDRREFLRTAGQHRADGAYVVERRGADSAGNRKVFDSFEAVERLFGRLPEQVTAEAVGRTGITGSRRHMLVRHFAEHPAFDCRTVSRNPLTVEKTSPPAERTEATAD